MEFTHIPVLFQETIDSLQIQPDGVYVDCTAGGGGLSKAILERLSKKGTLIAIDRDPEAIRYALGEGIIAAGAADADPELFGRADLVVFALYPHALVPWIEAYRSLLKPGALLTDVTGVKGAIVPEVQARLADGRPDVEFIAAHPMAGREVSGVRNSTADIFRSANYIVVPTEKNTKEAIAACRALGEALGFARVTELTPAEPDEIIGFVSQLTHCIAVALMTCNDD